MMQRNTEGRFIYVGSYAEKTSAGIHIYALNDSTGSLELIDHVARIDNPSFLTIDARHGILYSVSETDVNNAALLSFLIDSASGKLTYLGEQPTLGAAPCHVSMDADGEFLLVANYSGGNVNLFRVSPTGNLGEMADNVRHKGSGTRPDRQEAPHPHSAIMDPTNQYVFVPDLGLDKVVIYRLDKENGRLAPHREADVRPGAGPRHFAFHPSGTYGYVINELDSTITAFTYDANEGWIREFQTVSALPDGFYGESTCADIHISPAGNFLYGSNRGHDSIVVFAINRSDGTLTVVEHVATQGRTPRNFAITPDGALLLAANQDSDSIVTFRIDQQTGKLEPTGHITTVSKPVCVLMGW